MLSHLLLIAAVSSTNFAAGLATGVKVGEVTTDSAIIWIRSTEDIGRNEDGIHVAGRPAVPLREGLEIDELEGACPGAEGDVRVQYSTYDDLRNAVSTNWVTVDPLKDYAHSFQLKDLKPGTEYFYSAEVRDPGVTKATASLTGHFGTAPLPTENAEVTFTVVTGQYYGDLDDPAGYNIYASMLNLHPDFHVCTGDTVYYDNDAPAANSVEVARYHWQRMYSLPRLVAFQLAVPTYWEKDDHDTYFNDCWPSMVREEAGTLTFAKGQQIFLEEVPMGDSTYRTVRWGRALQIWLVEGRDFRSPNDMEDGPEKTIWGAKQKQWLKDTLLASDADWKILISPTPIVGPDREKKADNHANAAFAHEGNEMRTWFAENLPDHFFIVCGDRHWQYYSVDPKTGVQEFSCGPVSDEHAGGSPGKDPVYHRFHRVEGGFLSVTVSPAHLGSTLAFRFHDVDGNVVYETKFE